MLNFELEFHAQILRAYHSLEFLNHFEVHMRRAPLDVNFENYMYGRTSGGFRYYQADRGVAVAVSCADNKDVEFKRLDPKQALHAAIRYWKTWYQEGRNQGFDYGPTDCSQDNYLAFKRPELPEHHVDATLDRLTMDVPRLAKLCASTSYYENAIFVEMRSKNPKIRTPYFVVSIREHDRTVILDAYNLCQAHTEGCNKNTDSLALGNFYHLRATIDFDPGVSMYRYGPDYDVALTSIEAWVKNEVAETLDGFSFL